jgi:hypothetical protein
MKFSIVFLFGTAAVALPSPWGSFTNSTTATNTSLQGRAQPSASPLQGRALPSTAPLVPRYVALNNTVNSTTTITPSLKNSTVIKRPSFSRGNLTSSYFSRLRATRLQRLHQAQVSNNTAGTSNGTSLSRAQLTNSTASEIVNSTTVSAPSASTSPRFLPQVLQPGALDNN